MSLSDLSDTRAKSVVIEEARKRDIELSPDDIKGEPGDFTLDGMPWDQWLEAMTME